MSVKIFKNLEDFESRKDAKLNGVTQEFLDEHNLTLEEINETLINCSGCFNCLDCKNCYNCNNCYFSNNCYNCYETYHSNNINNYNTYCILLDNIIIT